MDLVESYADDLRFARKPLSRALLGGLVGVLVALPAYADAAWLAVPGAVVTGAGLTLLVDTATGLWRTWAYAWSLVYPTAAGSDSGSRGGGVGGPSWPRAAGAWSRSGCCSSPDSPPSSSSS